MARYRIVRTKHYKCFNVLRKSYFLGIPYWEKLSNREFGDYIFSETEATDYIQAVLNMEALRKKPEPWVDEWLSQPKIFREYE